jgi:hypothetical protein
MQRRTACGNSLAPMSIGPDVQSLRHQWPLSAVAIDVSSKHIFGFVVFQLIHNVVLMTPFFMMFGVYVGSCE